MQSLLTQLKERLRAYKLSYAVITAADKGRAIQFHATQQECPGGGNSILDEKAKVLSNDLRGYVDLYTKGVHNMGSDLLTMLELEFLTLDLAQRVCDLYDDNGEPISSSIDDLYPLEEGSEFKTAVQDWKRFSDKIDHA